MSNTKYPGLSEYLRSRILEDPGTSTRELYSEAILKFNYQGNFSAFVRLTCYNRTKALENLNNGLVDNLEDTKENKDYEHFLTILKKDRSLNVLDLSNMLDCSPRRVIEIADHYKHSGLEIIITKDNRIILSTTSVDKPKPIPTLTDSKEIIFGVASDLHIGSVATQITALNEFCHICHKKGIEHIFVPGDVVAGYGVYTGQVFDLYASSADSQAASVIKNLPTGFNWYLMGGNHDYSFVKSTGHNIVKVICREREDCHYVGFDDVTIPILNGVDLRMWHPSGGVPYSYSYRLQKNIEQLVYAELQDIVWERKDRPTIRFLLSGHLHIQLQALFGSVFGAQCGAFEGTTNYLKRKGYVPAIGGWIIQASLGKSGLLRNFDAKFYVFQEIENDYKNYDHDIPDGIDIEDPLFE